MSKRMLPLLLASIIAVVAGQSALYVSEAQSRSDAAYRIKLWDVINVKVAGTDYDDTVEVNERGMIHLTFTDGDIRAAGKTVEELKEEAATQLKKIFKNPSVEIRLLRRRT